MTPTEERIIYARAIAEIAGQFWIAWLRQSASTQHPGSVNPHCNSNQR